MKLTYVPHKEIKKLMPHFAASTTGLELFSTICRMNTLYAIKKAGSGHIGSSFSAMDIVSYLYLKEMTISRDEKDIYKNDIYYSSKGHDAPGLYSVLTALDFLSFDKIHNLRRLNGLPGHPDIHTPFIPTNTGSLGMGISKAKGFLRAKKAKKQAGTVYVLLGDGELQEGQFWESLASAANHGLNDIVAICDHNKVQSDQAVEKVSNLGDFQKKIESFGWYVDRINGHDFKALETSLKKAKTVNKPKFIIADTIKGRGISFMEPITTSESKYYKFHSGAPSDENYEKSVIEFKANIEKLIKALNLATINYDTNEFVSVAPAATAQKLIPHYSQLILNEAKKNPKIMALDADLVLDTGLIPLSEALPEQFIECGIAEMDMVSQAGALALSGYLPMVHSFACFLTPRANEQFFNNATEETKIIYSSSLAGLIPAGPGHSHQSVRDIALLASLPNLTMMEPASLKDLETIFDYAVNVNKQSSYIRFVSVPYEVPAELNDNFKKFEVGQGYELTKGKDAVLFTYGPIMVAEAIKAAKMLQEKFNLGLTVINMPWLNRVNKEWLKASISHTDYVFTMDNHFTKGGQGEFLISQIAELGTKKFYCKMFGVNSIPECGLPQEVLKHHGLDGETIANQINTFIKSTR
jgi:transketolase